MSFTTTARGAEKASETISVLIATRGRPEHLRRCLGSLRDQTRQPDRVVVVENVDRDPGTVAAVNETRAVGLQCLLEHEPRAGLGRAHNRGLPLCRDGIVAITDDDVIVDSEWIERLLDAFDADPRVGAVTGRILPMSLETPAQELTERYARYDKGEAVRDFSLDEPPDDPLFPLATGALGSGANMAFRSETLHEIGGFDAVLGVGTPAKGGDDLAALLDVLMGGWSVRYTPHAKVLHEHPRTVEALERQMYGYGAGLSAYLTRAVTRHPSLIWPAFRSAHRGLRHALSSSSAKNAGRGADFPARATRRERLGMLCGPVGYTRSRFSSRRSREPRRRGSHSMAPDACIPVLLYHAVSHDCAPAFRRWTVTPDEFGAQIEALQERGYRGVGIAELVREARAVGGPPPGLVGITFDDAFADVAWNALPTLRAAGFGATIFVPTGYVGGGAKWLAAEGEGSRPVMDWRQLADAQRAGFEIGAHSHLHPELDVLGTDEIRTEVEASAEMIDDHLGARPSAFAYPHGYYDERCRRAVRSAGFTHGWGVGHAYTSIEDDPLARARIIVSGGLSSAEFASLLDPSRARLAIAPLGRRIRRWAWRSARRMRAHRKPGG